ncbi:hypothetical protein IJJ27_00970 [bacterium]|nr:hypothetical protein [bacterium]
MSFSDVIGAFGILLKLIVIIGSTTLLLLFIGVVMSDFGSPLISHIGSQLIDIVKYGLRISVAGTFGLTISLIPWTLFALVAIFTNYQPPSWLHYLVIGPIAAFFAARALYAHK